MESKTATQSTPAALTIAGSDSGASSMHPVPPECLYSQIDQVVSYYHPCPIKTGMLYSSTIIEAVSKSLN